ncbi:Starch-binding associating with outer membrane [Chishuiella changwenlii]|uniref:Starch-binding associating with outer membrane n=1 Tax=Chishuiella changwenlii TaxID=1434701 RepID=A0A1M7C339_9FLAO|nr:RagB/SusD family nutrient uptake outer membrane protein [Chishuiella changwenlii]GGF05755.1 starch-binding protein [Chishuiella changwenlii]SHL61587.1 Starch-binding associating with outer membrane [Chishuiella changwenlii]
MNTKRYIKILGVSLILLTFNSCDDYLDVNSPSNTSESEVYNDTDYTYSALIAVYNQLAGDNGYGNRISSIIGQAADDFKTSGDYSCNDRRGISMYAACATNTELDRPFRQLYTGIERANLLIFNIPNSTVYTTGSNSDKALMDRYYGEALTLRAQFYYELIRNWGDVPFQDKPSSQYEHIFLPKTDRDEVYEVLLADLEKASKVIPWRAESNDPTSRVTKAYVKGLRARIALARAGYSLRRNPVQMVKGTDANKYYQIARDETFDIMQQRGSHNLNPNYEDVFRAINEGRMDNTNEMIFQVGAFGGNSRTDSKLGYYNGLRHNAASKWNGGGGLTALPTYFYEFNRYDQRRDVTINVFEINADDLSQVVKIDALTDGKFRKSWTKVTGPSQNLGINWPVLRFADVLLMYAEAENELNAGPTASAIEALREVRARAFSQNPSQMPEVNVGGHDAFFKEIVQERLLEFGGESIRKYDLIRWNLLGDVVTQTRQKLQRLLDGTGEYVNVPKYIYYKVGSYTPSQNAQQTVLSLDTYFVGTDKGNVFYAPSAASTPTGYTRINWQTAMVATMINDERKGWMQYYKANHSELLPIFQDIINTNYNLTQDYGY